MTPEQEKTIRELLQHALRDSMGIFAVLQGIKPAELEKENSVMTAIMALKRVERDLTGEKQVESHLPEVVLEILPER